MRYVFIAFALTVLNPFVTIAEDQKHDFQGYYSNKLKVRVDKMYSKVQQNLNKYRKDKSIARLDESHSLIIQSVDEIDFYLMTATQELRDVPDNAELKKLNAQIDKLEIITIRDSELPFLCEQLYEVGQLYVNVDITKAKRCFRDIVDKFTSYGLDDCSRRADSALEHLN